MGAVELIEPLTAAGEHRAALQDLDLGADFEHVAGRRHVEIGDIGSGEHVLDQVAGPGLDRTLVDRAGDDEIGPQHEGGGNGSGGTQAAGDAYPDSTGEPVAAGDLGAE